MRGTREGQPAGPSAPFPFAMRGEVGGRACSAAAQAEATRPHLRHSHSVHRLGLLLLSLASVTVIAEEPGAGARGGMALGGRGWCSGAHTFFCAPSLGELRYSLHNGILFGTLVMGRLILW